MRILGIETSGSLGGFAVVTDGHLVSEAVADVTGRHVEKGIAMIGEVLSRASVGLDQVDAVAVSLGPGSFTGLRVGLAIAKGLCLGKQIPLVGVPTLDCIAESISCSEGFIVPARDARRGEVYFSIYESRACSINRIADYLAMAPDRMAASVREQTSGQRVLVAGDALLRYGDIILGGLGAGAVQAPEAMWMARPAVVALMGAELLKAGGGADIDSIEPMYVRPSEAERRAKRLADNGISQDKKDD